MEAVNALLRKQTLQPAYVISIGWRGLAQSNVIN
jgi:hypothetical protein